MYWIHLAQQRDQCGNHTSGCGIVALVKACACRVAQEQPTAAVASGGMWQLRVFHNWATFHCRPTRVYLVPAYRCFRHGTYETDTHGTRMMMMMMMMMMTIIIMEEEK